MFLEKKILFRFRIARRMRRFFISGHTALNTFRPDEPINRAEVAKIIAMVRELQ